MKINPITNIQSKLKPIVLATMLLGAVSCSHRNQNDAFIKAQETMGIEEFNEAKNTYFWIRPLVNTYDNSYKINYWSDILKEQKIEESFNSGRQRIKDSLNGKFVRPYNKSLPIYQSPDLTGNTIVGVLKDEAKKYFSQEEMDSLINNEPKEKKRDISNDQRTYYWNNLSIEAAKREAYKKGAEYERYQQDSIKIKE